MQIHKAIPTALVLLATIAPIGLSTDGAWAKDPFPNGIASGDTTQTSTVLWARSETFGVVDFEVSTDPSFATIDAVESATVTDPNIPVKVEIEDLMPGLTYHYRVTDARGKSANGRFKTAHGVGEFAGLRFGVSGDWRGELSPYPAIANADELSLDFFVEHGDTIYADFPSPALNLEQAETLEDFRAKHAEVYGRRFKVNTWADLRASTSVSATIDDHEVTNDFAGGAPTGSDPRFADDPAALINDTELYENGLQVFQEFNPLRDEFYGVGAPVTAFERKLYRFNTYGGDAAVFVLDARSFRDAPLEGVTDPTDPAQIGDFLFQSAILPRTMLGMVQLTDLKADLLAAQEAGITWKFVLAPEPIQNLGVVAGEDRFEGYAKERNELLRFIDVSGIENVVFIAADLHGTLVNNLTYQSTVFGPQVPTGAFEVVTGSVAFDAPLGQELVELAFGLGLITPEEKAFYDSLPRDGKDQFVEGLIDSQIIPLGYDPLGLDGTMSVDATLLEGGYVAVHTFGWTEFEIDSGTQKLTVTTYGIDPYTEADLDHPPTRLAVLARTPEVVSRFEVVPAGLGRAVASASGS